MFPAKSSKICLCGLSELSLAPNTSLRPPRRRRRCSTASSDLDLRCEQTLVGQKYVRCGSGGERGNRSHPRPNNGHWDIVKVAACLNRASSKPKAGIAQPHVRMPEAGGSVGRAGFEIASYITLTAAAGVHSRAGTTVNILNLSLTKDVAPHSETDSRLMIHNFPAFSTQHYHKARPHPSSSVAVSLGMYSNLVRLSLVVQHH